MQCSVPLVHCKHQFPVQTQLKKSQQHGQQNIQMPQQIADKGKLPDDIFTMHGNSMLATSL